MVKLIGQSNQVNELIMKVLFAGFPKTGTKTIAEALRILGYSVFDYEEHFIYHEKECTSLLYGQHATKEDFQKMYVNVDAAVDGAVYIFWKDILDAFPDCKLIVNFRDEESWLKSFKHQNKVVIENLPFKLLACLTPTGFRYARFARLLSCVIYSGTGCFLPWQTFQGINFPILLKRYRQHNLQIQMEAPKDRLLVIDYKDGWEKICPFLDKPIPDVAFPHKNIRGSIVKELLKNHPFFLKLKRELLIVTSLLVLFCSVLIYCMFR